MFSYAINVDGDGRVSLSKRNKQRDIVRSTVSICSTILQLPTATLAGLTKQLYYSCAINIHTLTRSPAVKRHHWLTNILRNPGYMPWVLGHESLAFFLLTQPKTAVMLLGSDVWWVRSYYHCCQTWRLIKKTTSQQNEQSNEETSQGL